MNLEQLLDYLGQNGVKITESQLITELEDLGEDISSDLSDMAELILSDLKSRNSIVPVTKPSNNTITPESNISLETHPPTTEMFDAGQQLAYFNAKAFLEGYTLTSKELDKRIDNYLEVSRTEFLDRMKAKAESQSVKSEVELQGEVEDFFSRLHLG